MKPQIDNISVSVFAYTDVGRQRNSNEDAFLIADLTTGKVGLRPDIATHEVGERGTLLVVSDGMGGALGGEVASELAVTTIRESLLEVPSDLDACERLKMATEVANEVIWSAGQRDAALTGMGATLTAALVQGRVAHIAQVGDSRAYVIRGGQIKQITKDQSYAQMLVDSGVIKPDQMDSVPKNVIAQALGAQPGIRVALASVQICRNDYLILCSDGLTGKIDAEEIRGVVVGSPDLGAACRQLVGVANDRGGEDNITVVIASFDGSGLGAAVEGRTITDTFKVVEPGIAKNNAAAAETLPLASAPPAQDLSAVSPPSIAAPASLPTAPTGAPHADDLKPMPAAALTVPLQPPRPADLQPTDPQPANLTQVSPQVTTPQAAVKSYTVPGFEADETAETKPMKPAKSRTLLIVIVLLLLGLVAAYLIYEFVPIDLD